MANGKADYSKIINHPDRDQIIARLTNGDPVRTVSEWLKEKYPDNKYYQISFPFLNEFRRNHLNIQGNMLDDLKAKIKEQQIEEIKEPTSREIVKRNKSYDELMQKEIDLEVDLDKKLHQFLNVIEARFSDLFDSTRDNPSSIKPDKVMTDWMKTMLDIITHIRKERGLPDQIIQHNVAIQAVDGKIALFQQAFIKTLSKLDFELASMLIDDFNKNLAELKPDDDVYTPKDVEKDIKKIDTIIAKAEVVEVSQ